MTMIAQHGNDDYREKAISYLKGQAEGFRDEEVSQLASFRADVLDTGFEQ